MTDYSKFEMPAVIIDNGSGLCKAGLSGDHQPRTVIPSIIGRARESTALLGAGQKEFYVGEEAQSKRGILSLNYPIEHGIVTHWEDLEKLWWHIYNCELKVKSSERPVLLTTPPLNPLNNCQKMAELMFEEFKVPAVHFANQAALALYASARFTGIVLDIGDGVSHTAPIYNGYSMPYAVTRLNVAGRDITDYLMRLLLEGGYAFSTTAEREIVRDIKERHCYVALNTSEQLKESSSESAVQYKLPDGNVVNVGSQCFRAPEILFSPEHIGIEASGVHELVYSSIVKCPIDTRMELYNTILLSGGSSLFPGLVDRIFWEVQLQAPSGVKIQIIAPPERKFSVWIGASVLTRLPSFRPMWVTDSDYQEFGPSILLQNSG